MWSRIAGLLLVFAFIPFQGALAQEEEGEAMSYEQMKAEAEAMNMNKAYGALEAVAKGSGSLNNGKFDLSISVRFDATQQQLNTWKAQFNKASKLLYDATDGQHQFGTIHICNNSRGGKNADIWIHPPNGRSHVPGGCVPGLGKDGCHINLYAEDITDSNANADGAHTIAHEFGHYGYGIFDEYVTDPPKTSAICQVPETYQAPDPPGNSDGSLMENYWLRDITEFCVSSNHDGDNSNTAADESGDTWQEDVHGESAWETIKSNFPSITVPNGLPDQAMPAGHQDIEWKVLEPETRLSLVIDESGSMRGDKIDNAKSGAKLFVGLTQDGDKLGVISFDSNSQTVFSMQEANAGTRASAKAAIDNISAGGGTDINDGLNAGLNQITGAGDPACQQTIILLSDGISSTNPLIDAVPKLVQNDVTVHTIALGSGADESLLRNIAQQTGGKFFSPDNAADLPPVFAQLRTQTTENGGIITAAQSPVGSGQVVTQTVDVESGVQQSTFLINWGGTADVNLTLTSPSGATISPSSASGDPNVEHTSESNSEFYTVQNPEDGSWTMRIEGASSNTSTVDVSAQASSVSSEVSFTAVPDRVDVNYPTPMRIEAIPQAPVPVTGATVQGRVTRPDGSTAFIELRDDGTGGDTQADDGIYTALFDAYNQDGAYNFVITGTTGSLSKSFAVSGKAQSSTAKLLPGEALFTTEAMNGNLEAALGAEGDPAPVFTRAETFSANVNGVPAGLNAPPTAFDDSYQTPQDQGLAVPAPGVLNNDNDPDEDPLSVSAVNGNAGNVGSQIALANGTLTLNADGSFNYTPNGGFTGQDTFTYQVADGNGGTDQGTVTITVTQGGAPKAEDDEYFVKEDQRLEIVTPAASLVGNDEGTGLSIFLVSDVSNGTLELNADGTFSYEPNPDFFGTDSFVYEASNSNGSDQATVTLDVAAQPDPSSISAIADQEVPEDSSAGPIPFTVSDPDVPSDSLELRATSSNPALVPASNVTFGFADGESASAKSGHVSNRTVTVTPLPDSSGSTTIAVEVTDGTSRDTSHFEVTVTPVPDPPSIAAIANQEIAEDDSTGAIPFTISDAETPPQNLTVSATSSNQALVPDSNLTLGGTGASRTIQAVPLPDSTGSTTIQITVDDSTTNKAVGMASFDLTVTPVNDAPEVMAQLPDDNLKVPGPPLQLVGLAQTLFHDADGDPLTLTASSSAPSVVATSDSGGVVTLTPQAVGTAELTLTASDGEAETEADPVTITVVERPADEEVPSEEAAAFLGTLGTAPVLDFGDTGAVVTLHAVLQDGVVRFAFFGSGGDANGGATAATVASSKSHPNGSFENVSSYRWEVNASTAVVDSVDVGFRVADPDVRGIGDPSAVTVLVDSTGDGTYVPLRTTYDDRGTPSDSTDDLLVAHGLTHLEVTFKLASDSESNPLPVELADFTATLDGTAALLKWRTATETNNAGFEVQHQAPEATSYGQVGFVEGAGTTQEPQSYRFRVNDLAVGTHQFRLRQVDVDGSASLTDPVTVVVKAEQTLSLKATGPNPVRQATQFAFTVKKSGRATVTLYNVLGQEVRRLYDQQAAVGTLHTVEIQTDDLPSGTYFVRLSAPSGMRTQRIVVVR